jgi:prepilin-type N-terminal cleavage/methylation domain-containing protein
MRRPAASRGFSLIEVIVAVALFAGTVAVILALLPGLMRQGAENSDRLVAQQLAAPLRAELQRLSAAGFDALAGRVPAMGQPPVNGLAFVASRSGAELRSRDYLPPAQGRMAEEEQYFLIECWRYPEGPLAFDAAQSSLALAVRVSWPHRQPGAGAPAPAETRHELMFATGVNR